MKALYTTCSIIAIVFLSYFCYSKEKTKVRTIYFQQYATKLSQRGEKTLDSLIKKKEISKNAYFRIYGYSNFFGDSLECLQISSERAIAVKNYLIAKGIDERRIINCLGLGLIDSTSQAIDNDVAARYRKAELLIDNINAGGKDFTILKPVTIEKARLALPTQRNMPGDHAQVELAYAEQAVAIKATNGDLYFGGIDEHQCRQENGLYTWTNGDSYKGQFKNNLREGWGVYKWKTGETFEGLWRNDQPKQGILREDLDSRYLLKIVADRLCRLTINADPRADVQPGVPSNNYLEKGTYKIKLVDKKTKTDSFETLYMVKSYGKQDLINVRLGDGNSGADVQIVHLTGANGQKAKSDSMVNHITPRLLALQRDAENKESENAPKEKPVKETPQKIETISKQTVQQESNKLLNINTLEKSTARIELMQPAVPSADTAAKDIADLAKSNSSNRSKNQETDTLVIDANATQSEPDEKKLSLKNEISEPKKDSAKEQPRIEVQDQDSINNIKLINIDKKTKINNAYTDKNQNIVTENALDSSEKEIKLRDDNKANTIVSGNRNDDTLAKAQNETYKEKVMFITVPPTTITVSQAKDTAAKTVKDTSVAVAFPATAGQNSGSEVHNKKRKRHQTEAPTVDTPVTKSTIIHNYPTYVIKPRAVVPNKLDSTEGRKYVFHEWVPGKPDGLNENPAVVKPTESPKKPKHHWFKKKNKKKKD